MANITESFYSQLYKDSILSENPNLLNTFNEGQDNYFMQKSIGLAMSIVASEILGLQDNIFPASANSTYLDKHLAVANLPARLGTTPSTGTIKITIPANTTILSNYIIPVNTQMSNVITGYNYITNVLTTINSGLYSSATDIFISFISSQNGTNTASPINTNNNFTNPLIIPTSLTTNLTISTSIIVNITSGNNGQTDYDISYLINKNSRFPKGSGTIGDYFTWCLQSSPNITDAEIIPSSIISGYNNYFYVAVISGMRDPNFNITLTYPISRTTNQNDITVAKNYLETKRNILDNYNVISVGYIFNR